MTGPVQRSSPAVQSRVQSPGFTPTPINQALDVDQYPLPKPTDLFTTLAGGNILDLLQAYQQRTLVEETKKLVTIDTHCRLCRYTPFGVASAPARFQKLVLQGILCVICYIDGILVTGTSDEDHLRNLATVLFKFVHSYSPPSTAYCRSQKAFNQAKQALYSSCSL